MLNLVDQTKEIKVRKKSTDEEKISVNEKGIQSFSCCLKYGYALIILKLYSMQGV